MATHRFFFFLILVLWFEKRKMVYTAEQWKKKTE